MDPFSQGIVGAIAAQTAARRTHLGKAALLGALGGLAPDLDILIRSATDPLLFIEYHRHFTHSLFFIPVGGPLCGWLAFILFGRLWHLTLKQCVLWASLGYASHGMLDSFTSYGTRLLWPVSDLRVAWDLISIVDPLFTLPLGLLLVLAIRRCTHRYMALAVLWMATYLTLAGLQHHRALDIARELAGSREHQPAQLTAKPSFGNILVWKIIYRHEDHFYVDAVRPAPLPGLGEARYWEGDRIPALKLERDFPQLDRSSQQYRDIGRFALFSSHYLAVDPDQPDRIADIRYSLLPQQVEPLWGIEIDGQAGPEAHVHYYTQRDGSREALPALWKMIRGSAPAHRVPQ